MSTPLAKRRRLDAASTLSKPFRSPFKTPIKTDSTTKASSETPDQELALRHKPSSMINSSSTPIMNKPLHQLGSKILTPKPRLRTQGTFASPFRSSPMLAAVDPEISELMRKQRELEASLREVREELDTAEQARKIEGRSEEKGEEVDGELRGLVGKWKGATRRAAEDLFGGVKDRINKAGGPRAWKEAAKAAQESQAAWEAEGRELERLEAEKALGNSDDDASDPEDDEEEKMEKKNRTAIRNAYFDALHVEEEHGIEDETDLEKMQRVPGNIAVEDEVEDEYTMAEMLKTLNIPVEVIGYDVESQRWVD